MDKTEFLEKNIFLNLNNCNNGFDSEETLYFSESDFEIILQRIEKLGIGVFKIKPFIDGAFPEVKVHETYRKKATDSAWYKKAFAQLKKQQANLLYSATYKVSDKLLNRKSVIQGKEDLSLIQQLYKKEADAVLKKEKKKALKEKEEKNASL